MEQLNKDGGINMPDIHDMMHEVYSDVLAEMQQEQDKKHQRRYWKKQHKGLKITTYKNKVKK